MSATLPAPVRYIVQVYCTGMGWVDSRYQAESSAVAHDMERELRADDSKWVNPAAPKQTRIVMR